MRKVLFLSLVIFVFTLSASAQQFERIGISYKQVMDYLTNFFQMEKKTQVFGQDRYMGTTSDKQADLEVIGDKGNISSVTLSLRLSKDGKLAERNNTMMLRLLKNTVPNWKDSSNWANNTLEQITTASKNSRSIIHENKKITMQFFRPLNMVLLIVEHKHGGVAK